MKAVQSVCMRRFCQQFLFKITHLLLLVCECMRVRARVCVCVCVCVGGGGGTLACAVGGAHGRTIARGFKSVQTGTHDAETEV